MKIMVVEDDPVSLKLISKVLNKADYDVVPLDNAKDALDYLNDNNEVDIIISDIMMPEVNGFSFIRQVKREKRWRRIPIIFCTALNDEKSVKKGIELGVVEYITKPIDAKGVIERVKSTALKAAPQILIVENDKITRGHLGDMLSREGYRVIAADSIDDVAGHLKARALSLVITAIELPEQDGFKVLEKVKEHDLDIPVIMINSHGEKYGVEKILEFGADGYIKKPFINVEVTQQIEKILNKRQKAAAVR